MKKKKMKLVILNEQGNIPNGWITNGNGLYVKLPLIDNKYELDGYYYCSSMIDDIDKQLKSK